MGFVDDLRRWLSGEDEEDYDEDDDERDDDEYDDDEDEG